MDCVHISNFLQSLLSSNLGVYSIGPLIEHADMRSKSEQIMVCFYATILLQLKKRVHEDMLSGIT